MEFTVLKEIGQQLLPIKMALLKILVVFLLPSANG